MSAIEEEGADEEAEEIEGGGEDKAEELALEAGGEGVRRPSGAAERLLPLDSSSQTSTNSTGASTGRSIGRGARATLGLRVGVGSPAKSGAPFPNRV